MNSPEQTITYTISNGSIERRRALLSGVDATRKYLESIGATGGLAWLPLVRSRLYGEIIALAEQDNFVNTLGGISIIGSLDQSFAPTIPEALQRYRARAGSMPHIERAKRLGINLLMQRGLMPPVMKSLEPMRHIAKAVNSPQLFGNLYAEELPEHQTYNDTNAPYTRVAQISPDVLEKLDTTIRDLPAQLALHGIRKLSFSPYHTERRSFSGFTSIDPWQEYLSEFAERGLIRQFSVSLNRGGDLPASTGTDAATGTHVIARELIKEQADLEQLNPLPQQLATILEHRPPEAPLTINVAGNVRGLDRDRLRNVYRNLARLAAI